MTAPSYKVLCMHPECRELALYKIASDWSDGATHELKTYALACPEHLAIQYHHSCVRQSRCRLGDGESLSRPQVFRIESGRRDRDLVRMSELEEKLSDQ